MPTYQYSCTECSHAFEQFQSFSDDTLTECPECTGRVRKLFNAVGVVFKGSGFYRNDSRGTTTTADAPTTTTGTSEKSEKPSTPPAKSGDSTPAGSSSASSAAAG